jgi:hypothetical protein
MSSDAVVGLVVAGLILRSAIELAIEVAKTARGAGLDTSHFERDYERLWNRRQRGYFESWVLTLLAEPHSREEILAHHDLIFNTKDLPVVKYFSPARTFDFPKHLDSILSTLRDRGDISESGGHYLTTSNGKDALRVASRRWRFLPTEYAPSHRSDGRQVTSSPSGTRPRIH